MLLVDGEAKIQELELAIVSIQQVSASGALFPSTPHILAQAVECCAFFGIPLGIVSKGISDVSLQRGDPVDLVGGLQRHRDHGRLRHGRQLCMW